jgi:uncharacterized membrane protein YqjE
METNTRPSTGFIGSLRSLADHLLAGAQERVALFALEVQEEKLRLVQTFVWISAAVFTAVMAVTLGSLTLVYLLWESARLAVLGGLTLLYAAAVVAIVAGLRRFLARQPTPFAATLREIQEDRTCMGAGK